MARDHRRYGPVHSRGVRPWQRGRSGRDRPKEPIKWYIVKAGTIVDIRRLGSRDAWRSYTTKKAISCHGYVWRNRSHHGLAYGDFEIKVANHQFSTSEA